MQVCRKRWFGYVHGKPRKSAIGTALDSWQKEKSSWIKHFLAGQCRRYHRDTGEMSN